MQYFQRAIFVKIRVILDKKKLILKGLNVEHRAIFTLQGLEHIWWHSFSLLFENPIIYQIQKSKGITICKPLKTTCTWCYQLPENADFYSYVFDLHWMMAFQLKRKLIGRDHNEHCQCANHKISAKAAIF